MLIDVYYIRIEDLVIERETVGHVAHNPKSIVRVGEFIRKNRVSYFIKGLVEFKRFVPEITNK